MNLLELVDDVLYQIILAAEEIDIARQQNLGHEHDSERPPALLSLCMTCKRLRTIGAPLVYRRATYFKVHRGVRAIQVLRQGLVSGAVERRTTSAGIQPQNLLSGLTRLEKLRILACGSTVREKFLQEFEDVPFQLPNLRTMVVTNELQELALKLGKITALEIRFGYGLYASPHLAIKSGKLSNLRHLEISLCRMCNIWNTEFLVDLRVHCPQLVTIGTVTCEGGSSPPFLALLPYLAQFPALTVLATDRLEGLGPQYHLLTYTIGTPPGHNPERERLERVRVMREISNATFDQCRTLESLWMRDQGKATCERWGDGGVREIAWHEEQRLGTRGTLETSGFDMR